MIEEDDDEDDDEDFEDEIVTSHKPHINVKVLGSIDLNAHKKTKPKDEPKIDISGDVEISSIHRSDIKANTAAFRPPQNCYDEEL